MDKEVERSLATRSALIAIYNARIKIKDISSEDHLFCQTVHCQVNNIKKHQTLKNLNRSGLKR